MSEIKVDSIGPRVDSGTLTIGAAGDTVNIAGTASGIAASAIDSGTIATARLGSGTASSSTFLAGDQSYKTVSGTTINTNADNRVITGSGTANTLNGESGLTYDGSTFVTQATATCSYTFTKDSNNNMLQFNSNGLADAFRIYVENSSGGQVTFNTKDSGGTSRQRMRITPAGEFYINTTASVADGFFTMKFPDQTRRGMVLFGTDNDASANFMQFNANGTECGRVQRNGSNTVSFTTSSDYRLKENETPITDGITRLKTLKPYRFNFKADPDKTVDGFFAHEVSDVIPEAIQGKKDAMHPEVLYTADDELPEGKEIGDVKEETKINPQGIDQSKLVPLLTKALQEAITKIETLETKVTALENV